MLYKKGTNHKLHDLMVDYIIVDECDVDKSKAEGWSDSPADAHKGLSPDDIREAKTAKMLATRAANKEAKESK